MPLHLPPISRREFLKRAALTGAALALGPSAHAGLFGKSRDKHAFALLSDTHIAADAAQISGKINMADHLAAVGRELAALRKNPAAVVVNGDLAFKTGLPGDYAIFAGLIEPLRAVAPVHLLLGNHDHRENFWSAFPREAATQRAVASRQAAVLAAARANWFMLDSLDATDSTPGELGAAQLDWLRRELDSHRDKPAIVVAHHNLGRHNNIEGLKDSDALVELLSRCRQVKAFIFGHTHDWNVTQHASGVHLINLPPVAYVFKEGRPNGWVRATLALDGMELELRSLDPKHAAHGKVQRLNWRSA